VAWLEEIVPVTVNGCGSAPGLQAEDCEAPDESPYEALRGDTVMTAGVQDTESVMGAGSGEPPGAVAVRVSVTDQVLSGDVTTGGSTVSVTRMLDPAPMAGFPDDPGLPSLWVNA
jgi:hypothetical protein